MNIDDFEVFSKLSESIPGVIPLDVMQPSEYAWANYKLENGSIYIGIGKNDDLKSIFRVELQLVVSMGAYYYGGSWIQSFCVSMPKLVLLFKKGVDYAKKLSLPPSQTNERYLWGLGKIPVARSGFLK